MFGYRFSVKESVKIINVSNQVAAIIIRIICHVPVLKFVSFLSSLRLSVFPFLVYFQSYLSYLNLYEC